jgi:hypothetical protein
VKAAQDLSNGTGAIALPGRRLNMPLRWLREGYGFDVFIAVQESDGASQMKPSSYRQIDIQSDLTTVQTSAFS